MNMTSRGSRVKVFLGGYWGLGRGAKKLIFPDSVCAKLNVSGVQGPALGPLAGCRGLDYGRSLHEI